MYDSFYVILKGEIAVLVPVEKNMMMTDLEFYKYISNLRNKSEFEMIKLCIDSNPGFMSLDKEFGLLKTGGILRKSTISNPKKNGFVDYKIDSKENLLTDLNNKLNIFQ